MHPCAWLRLHFEGKARRISDSLLYGGREVKIKDNYKTSTWSHEKSRALTGERDPGQ